jgi:cyclopropane-fatty-acyl-phospholipid synthase
MTLRHWRERVLAHRKEVLTIFDERFIRMWEYYLAGFETSFRHYGLTVFQIQLAKKVDRVPLTRDYMYDSAQRATDTAARRASNPLRAV